VTDFGVFVRQRREALGLTVVSLGRKLKVSHGYISSIELGKFRPPSFRKVVALARILGVPARKMIEMAEKSRLASYLKIAKP
jgi:transcriptional regulator with XRE-family HTH domain